MGRKSLPLIFQRNLSNKDIPAMFTKLLGPMENYHDVNTIQYVNFRIIKEDKKLITRIVNTYNQKNKFPHNQYVKYLLRLYCSSVFTTDVLIERGNSDDNSSSFDKNLDIDYKLMKIDKDEYLREDKKVGIITKDIKLNFINTSPLFNNYKLEKYLFTKKDKYDKLVATYPDMLEKFKERFIYLYPFDNLKNITYLLNEFRKYIKPKDTDLMLIEGSEESGLSNLGHSDKIISDVLVFAFVKDGDVCK
jgi:hypothetical protein